MYCASLAGSFWVVSAVLGVFFGVLLVIIVSCTLRSRCMSCASVLCIFVLCAVHCIVLSVQDVLCLCGALAGADNGFPRLTWRAAAHSDDDDDCGDVDVDLDDDDVVAHADI